VEIGQASNCRFFANKHANKTLKSKRNQVNKEEPHVGKPTDIYIKGKTTKIQASDEHKNKEEKLSC